MSDQDNPIETPPEEENNHEASQREGEAKEEAEILIPISEAEFEAYQNAIKTAQKDAENYKDGMLRAQADYQNLRRRTALEKEQMMVEAVGKVVTPFLDILDDLELAVKNRPGNLSDNGWSEGIELVYRKLLNRLESEGISRIEALGKPFDPHFHEAIVQETSDEYESGHVMDVVKPGYMAGERVLRPAMVRVAA